VKKLNLKRRKCRHCNEFFRPDYRNGQHQHYCGNAECRRASKAASQRRWLHHSGNQDYFHGPQHVRRVQEWRKEHPGYWKRQTDKSGQTQAPGAQAVNRRQSSCNVPSSPLSTLQDYCLAQEPGFIGLISMITGSTLQEDIAATVDRILNRGQSILRHGLSNSRSVQLCFDYDGQVSVAAGAAAPGSSEL
jgi:hypothetical protein